jgi:hypothetical protein
MTIVGLCAAYDVADKAFRAGNAKGFPVGGNAEYVRLNVAETSARKAIAKNVELAMAQRQLNVLAYFAAWAIMRGGFKP